MNAAFLFFMDSIIHLNVVGSTNDEMQHLLACNHDDVAEGTLVYADEQTNGRGQVGNHWESESGKNLLASIVLFPDFLPADRQFLVTQIGALAVRDFLTSHVGLNNVTVKWPNDVYVQDKKISGTLNEAMLMGKRMAYVILGVGINLNQKTFSSYPVNPVSVLHLTGKEFDVDRAAVLLRQCVMLRYMQLVNGEEEQIRSEYLSVMYRRHGFYEYEDESGCVFSAKLVTVHPEGELELELRDGKHRTFLFKQVKFVL